jgi:tRNA threonylcarbamoyl adenosine modification protein YeaZ
MGCHVSRSADGREWRLVIDTATRQSTVALGDGRVPVAQSTRLSEHRHGAMLLEQIQEVLDEAGARRNDIAAIGVGTGPGSFTGLRVGLATAKTLAYALGTPIVGIPTAGAIARAVAETAPPHAGEGEADAFVVILPAGARDHYLAIPGIEPQLVPPGVDLAAAAQGTGRLPVAVDMPGSDLGADAAERGSEGLRGLGTAMLAMLDERLATGTPDDVAALVPAYVALPRGISAAVEGMAWSPDLR